MPVSKATAISNSNIAFIKYWGNRDHKLRLPATSSLSMNLEGLHTRTTVAFDPGLPADVVVLDNAAQSPEASARVSQHLDRVRAAAGFKTFARVDSQVLAGLRFVLQRQVNQQGLRLADRKRRQSFAHAHF